MFGRSFRLPFKLAGIPLEMDISFLLILPLMAWLIGSRVGALAHMWGIPGAHGLELGATPYVLGLIAAVGLFVCVVLHELGHSLVARAFGVKVRSITLWFLGGMAQFEEIPRRKGEEAIVGVAGPAVSFILAAGFWGAAMIVPRWPALLFVLAYLAITNLVLGVFNLIPAIPLDGGRILRSILALFMSFGGATRAAGMVSQILAVCMGLYGLLSGQWFLLLIAVFVFMAGRSETRATDIGELLAGAHVSDLMTSPAPSVKPNLSVGELSSKIVHEHHTSFPVVDESENVVGVVGVKEMARQPSNAQVAEIMSTHVPMVAPADEAAAAFRRMNENGLDLLVVTDGARHLLGVLTRMDFVRMIQLRSMTAGVLRGGTHARPT